MATQKRDPKQVAAPSLDPRNFGLIKAAYSVNETIDLLSIGRTKFYELVDNGDLKITKLGNKSLVYVTDIVALLSRLRGNTVPVEDSRLHNGESNDSMMTGTNSF